MRWLKIAGVVFAAVTITALGIDATDTLTGKSGTLLGQLVGTEGGVCPRGMVEVPNALSFTCIDRFEAATGEACSTSNPQNGFQSKENLDQADCGAVSETARETWRYVTREQAQTACARSGKRLPSSYEWYLASLGTVDSEDTCNISSTGSQDTGSNAGCLSAAGAEDMIGNVWEWVNDDVIDGQYNNRSLPTTGYVEQVDIGGVGTVTGNDPAALYNDDYLWSSESGAYAVMRGGFYGSDSDAGIYAFHAKTLPTTVGTAIGFRCVK